MLQNVNLVVERWNLLMNGHGVEIDVVDANLGG